MKYCSNCNAILKEGVKFCSKCGAPVQKIESQDKVTDDQETTFQTHTLNPKEKKNFPLNKILLGISIIVVLLFIAKSFLPNDEQLSVLVGKWHDPTGILLGDEEAIITFREKGDVVVGEDKDKIIFIQLLPTGSNNYSGLVVLNGIDGDFEVHFNEEKDKLVFFSTLTKTSWNIKKLKR